MKNPPAFPCPSSGTMSPRIPEAELAALESELERVKQQCDELLASWQKVDEIAASLDCIVGVSAEGRKARAYGLKLHRIAQAAIANAEGKQFSDNYGKKK